MKLLFAAVYVTLSSIAVAAPSCNEGSEVLKFNTEANIAIANLPDLIVKFKDIERTKETEDLTFCTAQMYSIDPRNGEESFPTPIKFTVWYDAYGDAKAAHEVDVDAKTEHVQCKDGIPIVKKHFAARYPDEEIEVIAGDPWVVEQSMNEASCTVSVEIMGRVTESESSGRGGRIASGAPAGSRKRLDKVQFEYNVKRSETGQLTVSN